MPQKQRLRTTGRTRSQVEDGSSSSVRVLHLLTSAESQLTFDLDKARLLSAKSLTIARTSGEKHLIAASLAMQARAELYRGDRNRAAQTYRQALQLYEKSGDLDAILEMQHGLEDAKLTTGNEHARLERLHELLRDRTSRSAGNRASETKESAVGGFYIARSWQDRVLGRVPAADKIETYHRIKLGAIYGSLGYAYLVIREHHKAASLLEEQFAIYKSLKHSGRNALVASALNDLGYVHVLLGNRVVALEYAQQGLKLAKQLRDKRAIAYNQRNLAQLYLHTGQPALGKRFALLSFRTAREAGLIELASRALVTLTRYERLHGSPAKAEALNATALELLEEIEKGAPYYYFTLQQILIEHARHPSKKVYAKLERLHQTTRELGLEIQHEIAQEIAHVAEELRMLPDAVKWFKKVHEYEIVRLNTEQRSALLSLQKEQELERLAKEREVQRLEMEKLAIELERGSREAQLLAVQLAKKGSFLASLTEQLSTLKESSQRYSPETIDAVIALIESIRHRDKDYEQLEERAEALHHHFIVALTEEYPELTAAERRICILLRLGLSTQDIANVLFTSIRTIETHALSIRKKLRIPNNTRLGKYIASCEGPTRG